MKKNNPREIIYLMSLSIYFMFGQRTFEIGKSLCMISGCSEADTRGVLFKKVFLEISQNSQKNSCRPPWHSGDSGTGVFLRIL